MSFLTIKELPWSRCLFPVMATLTKTLVSDDVALQNSPSEWQMFPHGTGSFYSLSLDAGPGTVLVGFCDALQALSTILRLSGHLRDLVWNVQWECKDLYPSLGRAGQEGQEECSDTFLFQGHVTWVYEINNLHESQAFYSFMKLWYKICPWKMGPLLQRGP